jgi:hypothetical protein
VGTGHTGSWCIGPLTLTTFQDFEQDIRNAVWPDPAFSDANAAIQFTAHAKHTAAW